MNTLRGLFRCGLLLAVASAFGVIGLMGVGYNRTMVVMSQDEASTTALQMSPIENSIANIPSVIANQGADWLTIFPSHTLPVTANSSWVRDLRQATRLSGPQITLVVCSEKYLGALANWLVYAVLQASLPVKNLLVMSLDIATHQTLTNKGFQSVYIPRYSIMQPDFRSRHFSAVWITRLTVIRLLNSWKYNVLIMDSDALILKDIQSLLDYFDNSDIIASTGFYPGTLHRMWNTSLCMGVALFKATPATEYFWRMMKIKTETTDDQLAVNYVFYYMEIKFKPLNTEAYQYYQGITSNPVSLQVTLLPNSVICRHCTDDLKEITYVWHPYFHKSGNNKKIQMTKDNTWKLRDNWNATLQNSKTANEWLLSIIQ